MKKPEFIRREFPAWATRDEMAAWIRSHFDKGQGVFCPLCFGKIKTYDRVMSVAPAQVLRELFRRDQGKAYVDMGAVLDACPSRTARQGGYGLLGKHWGLIEKMEGERPDGSKRVGLWRMTDKGRAFVRGDITIPRTAYVYRDQPQGYSVDHTTMSEALKEPFDYREMMGDGE